MIVVSSLKVPWGHVICTRHFWETGGDKLWMATWWEKVIWREDNFQGGRGGGSDPERHHDISN